MCTCLCACICTCMWVPEEARRGCGPLGAGVPGGCNLANMCPRKWIQACSSSILSSHWAFSLAPKSFFVNDNRNFICFKFHCNDYDEHTFLGAHILINTLSLSLFSLGLVRAKWILTKSPQTMWFLLFYFLKYLHFFFLLYGFWCYVAWPTKLDRYILYCAVYQHKLFLLSG